MNNLLCMAWIFSQALQIHRAHKTKVPFAASPAFTPFGFHHILHGHSSQQHQVLRCLKQEETIGQARNSETQSFNSVCLGDLGPKPVWWWGAEADDSTPLFLNAPLVLKDTSPSCCSQNQAGLYSWVKTECQAVYFLYFSVEMRLFLCLCGADTACSQPVKCGTFPVI